MYKISLYYQFCYAKNDITELRKCKLKVMIYNCVYCNYKTDKKNSFAVHAKSKKHLRKEKEYFKKYNKVPDSQSELPNQRKPQQRTPQKKQNQTSNPEIKKEEIKKEVKKEAKREEVKIEDQVESPIVTPSPNIDIVNDTELTDTELTDTELNDNSSRNKNPSRKVKKIKINAENDININVVRLVSFGNLDDFYKTVSDSFLQQIRIYSEFDFLKLNKPQQEAFDYMRKKYCYLDPEISKELLKDLKLSLIVSNFLSESESPFNLKTV